MKVFFRPLLQELRSIQQHGGLFINVGGQKHYLMPVITQCCCDLPAKAEVQGMINNNGYWSCGYCLQKGDSIKSVKNAKSFVRYVRQEKPIEKRTHQTMLQAYDGLKSDSIMGVKKISCMVAAKNFDLVNSYGIDYMHCVLLGVQSKMLKLWLDSVNHKKPYYIQPKWQNVLSDRITKITPTSDISRKPRPLSDRAKYKANEFRSLLYCFIYHTRLLGCCQVGTSITSDFYPRQYICSYKNKLPLKRLPLLKSN